MFRQIVIEIDEEKYMSKKLLCDPLEMINIYGFSFIKHDLQELIIKKMLNEIGEIEDMSKDGT